MQTIRAVGYAGFWPGIVAAVAAYLTVLLEDAAGQSTTSVP